MLTYCVKYRKKTGNLNSKILQAKALLSSLGLKIPFNKIPLFSNILFWLYKINEIVNKFLLAGHKFMPEMHLKQPGFTYSVCGPFTKNK